jgi:hypothetical protein
VKSTSGGSATLEVVDIGQGARARPGVRSTLARTAKSPTEHIGAAFLAYRLPQSLSGRSLMRLFFGIIIGCLLTVGVAYVIDTMSPSAGSRMVNWEVVGKNIDTLTNMAREGWKKITG